ncbi:hypothetical protein QNH39_25665 [Neobacillus novalis]|uniref:Uncharacterized protein n=1 Tax=Neobacillus novalis TaxID=220687 RepID=A0AA95MST8_9BACI|nr:hypothetical protein [Neobacillus novalis]WHY85923.1 hypothetical protein QNH39_25665 [Neobacillus novalis]
MENNLVFNIPSYTDDNSAFPKPVHRNYDYWVPLINHFLAKSDTIEIHCWNEEIDTIEEIKSLHIGTFEMFKEENITIFKGKKTSTLSDYLMNNNMNIFGEFKWFTVNFDKGMVPVFHSGHWGTEFFVPNAMEKDIAIIKSVTPTETSFNQY